MSKRKMLHCHAPSIVDQAYTLLVRNAKGDGSDVTWESFWHMMRSGAGQSSIGQSRSFERLLVRIHCAGSRPSPMCGSRSLDLVAYDAYDCVLRTLKGSSAKTNADVASIATTQTFLRFVCHRFRGSERLPCAHPTESVHRPFVRATHVQQPFFEASRKRREAISVVTRPPDRIQRATTRKTALVVSDKRARNRSTSISFKLTWLVLGEDPTARSHRVEQFTAL